MQTPKKVDLLLSGCDVVTIDGKNRVIRDGAVAVKGNKIVWIGKASAAKRLGIARQRLYDRLAVLSARHGLDFDLPQTRVELSLEAWAARMSELTETPRP